jgi:hypothetical protein
MNLNFVNILPNIYWFYLEIDKDKIENTNIISNRIQDFCKLKGINKLIRLDQDTSYWNKHNIYNEAIQKQIVEMEANKLINYLNSKINQIKQDYLNYNKTLIISNNYTDVAIILFIYLMEEMCNMNYKQSLLSIQSKMNSKLVIQNQNTKLLLQKK